MSKSFDKYYYRLRYTNTSRLQINPTPNSPTNNNNKTTIIMSICVDTYYYRLHTDYITDSVTQIH